MHPLIRIEHVDVLLFLRGKYIGSMDPRPSQDQQGTSRDKRERKCLFRRNKERSDNTMN
jgi:hypothetical protein